MSRDADRVVIRPRFWPRFMRWAVGFQLAFGLLVGVTVASRGLNGQPLFDLKDGMSWGVTSALLGGFCLFRTLLWRNVEGAELSETGIRPLNRASRWKRRYPWPDVSAVWVRVGWFGKRWIEAQVGDDPPFPLTTRPSNPDAVLDALERFAGPDHPLTLAMAEETEARR